MRLLVLQTIKKQHQGIENYLYIKEGFYRV